jgi:creatinine amidohydrolase
MFQFNGLTAGNFARYPPGMTIWSAAALGLALCAGCSPADAGVPTPPEAAVPAAPRGHLLWDLTWEQAEHVLTPDAVVVIPLGAASKEHGPHLLLKNDWLLAEYYKDRVYQQADVVIAPTVGLHYYPAFTEYPGSITLRHETSRDLIVDIVRSLAAYGPRRFYVLNTGVSTTGPLNAAIDVLASEGIVLRFTDVLATLAPVIDEIAEQEGGMHADEVETSMMLYIAPRTVTMSKAAKDYTRKIKSGLSRSPDGPGHYSKTGIFGDATLATRAKGRRFVEAMVEGILADIEALRGTKPPPGSPSPATDYVFGAPS